MNEFTFHIGKDFFVVNINKKKRKLTVSLIIDDKAHEVDDIILPKIVKNKCKKDSDDQFFFEY